jgi:hypothetical protein
MMNMFDSSAHLINRNSAFGHKATSGLAFGHKLTSGPSFGHNTASGPAFGHNMASGPAFGHKLASSPASGHNWPLVQPLATSWHAFGHNILVELIGHVTQTIGPKIQTQLIVKLSPATSSDGT